MIPNLITPVTMLSGSNLKNSTNNRNIFRVLIAVIIAIIFSWFIYAEFFSGPDLSRIKNYPSRGTGIIAFGDSLVFGVGSGSSPNGDSSSGGFVSILSKKLGVPIINIGVSGNTTSDGLARVDSIFGTDPSSGSSFVQNESDQPYVNPKVVILLLGGNDFLRKIPKEQTFQNLANIIDKIQERGSIVLLLGIRGGVLSDNYESSFADLAKKKGTAYVPNVMDGILFHQDLMFDGIHPNQKGYEIIAKKIEPVLKALIAN